MRGCNYVVCGWYTPDYAHWADRLVADLDGLGIAHDFVVADTKLDTWEANTMRKPAYVQAAMDRHPDKTIIFLDVDCRVLADLAPLAAIHGDVGFYMRTKFKRGGGVRFGVRSGTMVLKPNAEARRFVAAWIDAAGHAPWGSVDQTPLCVAMGRSPGVSIESLDVAYCATEGDRCGNPIVLHDKASGDAKKIGKVERCLRGRLDGVTIFSAIGIVALTWFMLGEGRPADIISPAAQASKGPCNE